MFCLTAIVLVYNISVFAGNLLGHSMVTVVETRQLSDDEVPMITICQEGKNLLYFTLSMFCTL